MQFLKGKDVKGMVKKNLNHILPYILMLFIDIKRSLQILKRIKEPDLILQQCHLSPLTDTIFLHFTWIPSLVLIASNLHTLSLSLSVSLSSAFQLLHEGWTCLYTYSYKKQYKSRESGASLTTSDVSTHFMMASALTRSLSHSEQYVV